MGLLSLRRHRQALTVQSHLPSLTVRIPHTAQTYQRSTDGYSYHEYADIGEIGSPATTPGTCSTGAVYGAHVVSNHGSTTPTISEVSRDPTQSYANAPDRSPGGAGSSADNSTRLS